MRFVIQPSAKKELKKLDRQIIEVILKKFYSIQNNPLPNLIRLKNSPFWKLRIGDYRAIVVINTKDQIVNVIKIGHRKNIYKRL
ncbi:type II toxin-antitoxin system RelE/ParE family toxin [Candidatus Woesearchaeota archaeon]|nr:type II toxin-antitoxin system RelE/ParE family toxin [Candidatus Woesearchaeota archaeon]